MVGDMNENDVQF